MRPGTAIGLSALLHALAALGLSVARWGNPPAAKRPAPTFWATMREPERPPTPPEPQPAIAAPREQPARVQPAEKPAIRGVETRAAPAPTTPQESVPVPSSSQPTEERALDLDEARRRAAVEVLRERERAGSYRSFTFPGTIAEQEAFDEAERFHRVERGLQAPLTAFDSPAKGRAGITETDAFGQTVRWISDDCYQTTGTHNLFLLPATAGLFAIPMTNCAVPPPRADLFAAAKPDYLMDEAERAATTAASARRERLRRPTTDVVMSL